MNKAFFVCGSLDGTFQDVQPGTKTFGVGANSLIPGQGFVPDSVDTYKVATFLLAPGVARRIFVDSTLSEAEVEEKMGYFMADLWDECAEANE